MHYDPDNKKMLQYVLTCAKDSGFTTNLYFSANPLKRYFVRTNLMKFITAVKNVRNKKDVLDFGPGLSRIFDRITGLDIDENQCLSAKKIIRDNSIPNVNVVCKSPDVEFEDFQDESFDCIIAHNVLEHIRYHEQILWNFYCILRQDGQLIVSLPSENIIYRTFESKNYGHFLRSSKEIQALLRDIGKYFKEVENLDIKPIFLTRIFLKAMKV